MTNPFTAKVKPKSKSSNPFAAKVRKQLPAPKQVNNAPTKPNPWTAKKKIKISDYLGPQTKGYRHPGADKADFVRDGVKYTNPRDQGDYWTVDAVNGDVTYSFHNRHKAWFMDLDGGMMKEPLIFVAGGLQARYLAELRRIGAELPYSARTEQDKRAKGKDKKPKQQPKAKDNPFTSNAKKRRRHARR